MKFQGSIKVCVITLGFGKLAKVKTSDVRQTVDIMNSSVHRIKAINAN